MSSAALKAFELFSSQIGKPDEPGEWMVVDQARINQFADATLDHQYIHVDPEKSREMSPYGVTIAHGFLTVSLVPYLLKSVPRQHPEAWDTVASGVNYGFNRLRFPNPVKVDSKVRATRELAEVTQVSENTLQLTQKVSVEIDGEKKPACAAEFLVRLNYA